MSGENLRELWNLIVHSRKYDPRKNSGSRLLLVIFGGVGYRRVRNKVFCQGGTVISQSSSTKHGTARTAACWSPSYLRIERAISPVYCRTNKIFFHEGDRSYCAHFTSLQSKSQTTYLKLPFWCVAEHIESQLQNQSQVHRYSEYQLEGCRTNFNTTLL